MPLFNVSQLERALELLKDKVKLCPRKFRDSRMPRISSKSDFGRVRSARPLAETLGMTLMEELIQLGEVRYWINQMNEHLWLYQSTLSQTF